VIKEMGINKIGFEQDKMTYGTYAAYKEQLGAAELVPVSQSVEKLRLIKSSEEIKILKEAAKIADDAFSHILTVIKPGITEIEVANELEFYMRSQGADHSVLRCDRGIRRTLKSAARSGKRQSD
jgi:Xaa-Pro aminopeptidase